MTPLEPEKLLPLLDTFGVDAGADGGSALQRWAAGSVRKAILLTRFGGLDIIEATRAVARTDAFDIGEAMRLGEAVSGRDRQVQFDVFNAAALDLVSDRAAALAEAGQRAAASHLAAVWQTIGAGIQATETYNLDRKQHVIGVVSQLHACFGGGKQDMGTAQR